MNDVDILDGTETELIPGSKVWIGDKFMIELSMSQF
jgi:hypothetical protein